MKKIIVLALAVWMICCCLVACNSTEDTEQKFTVYFGLNDKDTGTQVLTVEEAQAAARKIITDNGFGYTEYVTHGGYVENGGVIENDTLVYMMIFIERADAEAVAKEIKDELNLASKLCCNYDKYHILKYF